MDDSFILGRKALRSGNKDIELGSTSLPSRAICCIAQASVGYSVFSSENPEVESDCPPSGTLASITLLYIPHVPEIVVPFIDTCVLCD